MVGGNARGMAIGHWGVCFNLIQNIFPSLHTNCMLMAGRDDCTDIAAIQPRDENDQVTKDK